MAQGAPDQAARRGRGAAAAVSAAKLARVSIMTGNFTSRLKVEGRAQNPDRILSPNSGNMHMPSGSPTTSMVTRRR
jgi:hypothetical protein